MLGKGVVDRSGGVERPLVSIGQIDWEGVYLIVVDEDVDHEVIVLTLIFQL